MSRWWITGLCPGRQGPSACPNPGSAAASPCWRNDSGCVLSSVPPAASPSPNSGRLYYTCCRAMLVEADAALDLTPRPRASLAVWCASPAPSIRSTPTSGGCWSLFALAHPSVKVQLVGANRAVDLVAEGLDMALRVRPLPLRTAISPCGCWVMRDPVSRWQARPLSRHSACPGPADLLSWPSLGHGASLEGHHWTLLGPNGARVKQHHSPALPPPTCRHCVRGDRRARVVQLPTMMMDEPLADGRLVRLLPDWAPRQEVIHAVFPSRRGLLPPSAPHRSSGRGLLPWGRQVRSSCHDLCMAVPGVLTCKARAWLWPFHFPLHRGGETDTGSILRRAFGPGAVACRRSARPILALFCSSTMAHGVIDGGGDQIFQHLPLSSSIRLGSIRYDARCGCRPWSP